MKPTAAQKRRFYRVAQLPCLACGGWPTEVHHCRHECGMSQRNHDQIAPLCGGCHRASTFSRHLDPKEFAERVGTDLELHEKTCELLGES